MFACFDIHQSSATVTGVNLNTLHSVQLILELINHSASNYIRYNYHPEVVTKYKLRYVMNPSHVDCLKLNLCGAGMYQKGTCMLGRL